MSILLIISDKGWLPRICWLFLSKILCLINATKCYKTLHWIICYNTGNSAHFSTIKLWLWCAPIKVFGKLFKNTAYEWMSNHWLKVQLLLTDLCGNEDEVGEDTSQCTVAQNVAGIDDTGNQEHWGNEQSSSKYCDLKHSVAVSGQNINHLEGERERERELTSKSLLFLFDIFFHSHCLEYTDGYSYMATYSFPWYKFLVLQTFFLATFLTHLAVTCIAYCKSLTMVEQEGEAIRN